MHEVKGDMKLGEAANASWAVSRAYGVGIVAYVAYLVALVVVVFGTGSLVHAALPAGVADLLVLPVLIVAGVGGIWAYLQWRRWRMAKAVEARGTPLVTAISIRVEENALLLQSPHVTTSIGWPAITEVIRAKGYWIFLASGMGWCVPRRFFASTGDEKAFLRAALESMGAAARARSDEAMAFLGPWD